MTTTSGVEWSSGESLSVDAGHPLTVTVTPSSMPYGVSPLLRDHGRGIKKAASQEQEVTDLQ